MPPFDLPPDTAVLTTSLVMHEKRPILLVSHDLDNDAPDDESWQFHDGSGDYDPRLLMIVALSSIVALDPTVQEVAAMPPGHTATRTAVGEPWLIKPETATPT